MVVFQIVDISLETRSMSDADASTRARLVRYNDPCAVPVGVKNGSLRLGGLRSKACQSWPVNTPYDRREVVAMESAVTVTQ